MDRNHTDASPCLPAFPRFRGQTFLERGDRDLALACVRAYKDWMFGEWCADAARGRLRGKAISCYRLDNYGITARRNPTSFRSRPALRR